MSIEINMRLDCGRGYTERQFANLEKGAVAILGRYGPVEHRVRRLWMGQPRRIVAKVHVDDIPTPDLAALAFRFHQACLAIYYPDSNVGRLVGPNAGEWGAFKLEEFERFDESLNPSRSTPPNPKYVPSDDPAIEQEQLTAMYDRVRQVFPRDLLDSMAPQQRTLTDNAINRVLNKDGPEALTLDRLDGIKELVTQHLWSPAHTAVFSQSPNSQTKMQ